MVSTKTTFALLYHSISIFLENISVQTIKSFLQIQKKNAHTASSLTNVNRTPSTNSDEAKVVKWLL